MKCVFLSQYPESYLGGQVMSTKILYQAVRDLGHETEIIFPETFLSSSEFKSLIETYKSQYDQVFIIPDRPHFINQVSKIKDLSNVNVLFLTLTSGISWFGVKDYLKDVILRARTFVTLSPDHMSPLFKNDSNLNPYPKYIPLRLHPSMIPPLPPKTENYDVITVGRLVESKGHHVVAKICQKLGLKHVIVASMDPSSRAKSEEYLNYLRSLGSPVILNERPWKYLRQSKVYVSHSSFDTYGISAIEAIISGLRVFILHKGHMTYPIEDMSKFGAVGYKNIRELESILRNYETYKPASMDVEAEWKAFLTQVKEAFEL